MKTPERTQYDWHITASFHMITWLRCRPRHSGLGTGSTFTFALSGKCTSHGVCEEIHCLIKHDLFNGSIAGETEPHISMHESVTVNCQKNNHRTSLAPIENYTQPYLNKGEHDKTRYSSTLEGRGEETR